MLSGFMSSTKEWRGQFSADTPCLSRTHYVHNVIVWVVVVILSYFWEELVELLSLVRTPDSLAAPVCL